MFVRRKDGCLLSRYVYLESREGQEYVCMDGAKELRRDSIPLSLSTPGASPTTQPRSCVGCMSYLLLIATVTAHETGGCDRPTMLDPGTNTYFPLSAVRRCQVDGTGPLVGGPTHYKGTSYPTCFDILCLTVTFSLCCSGCVSPCPLSLAHRNSNTMGNDVL